MERVILHSDLNNFYASVECLYYPELRGKPVAVGGDEEARHGIVLAKNEKAKQYGIKTGNTLWEARRRCPELVIVPPHYDQYLRYSRMAQEIYAQYTDQVEAFGLDECWLDVTGSTKLFGEGRTIANAVRRQIKEELGVTASVGVSWNKVFAKLGSDYKKPDAITEFTKENYRELVWPLPVEALLYVGSATSRKLRRYGIQTIGDLANAPVEFLQYKLGKIGRMLKEFANGEERSPVSRIGEAPMVKSVGNSTTAPRDLNTDEDVKITLYALCESVAERLREQGLLCTVVQIAVRNSRLEYYDRQGRLCSPSCNSKTLYDKAFELYKRHHHGEPIRSIGIKAAGLLGMDADQLSIMPEAAKSQKLDRLEQAVDDVRRRYGHFAVQRGIMLADEKLSAVNPKEDHIIHPAGFLKP